MWGVEGTMFQEFICVGCRGNYVSGVYICGV